ncbi:MAG: ADP-ribosylglycohydrolase family protein [Parvibaculaceae bacterium]
MPFSDLSKLERHALACLAFGAIGDAMGTPTELLEPGEIEQRFGWVETFEGDGTDDSIMRDFLAAAMVKTGGYATADDWAVEWQANRAMIFGDKISKFFPSVLHAAEKLNRGYLPCVIAEGTMPSTTSAMAISPVGIVNAGHPRAAAAQAMEIASLIHVTDVAFCQDSAAAVAAAIAVALRPGATVDAVIQAGLDAIRPWSGKEMSGLISNALALASSSDDYKAFRSAYHQRFRRPIFCDCRETVPAAFGIVQLAKGDPWQAVMLGANFGRDTDTIACMAGAICGALAGIDADVEAKLALLPASGLDLQRKLAKDLVAVRNRRAEAERQALASAY